LQLVEHLSELRASRKSAEDKVTTIHVKVPYQVVGLVVGPKGATVKRIQQVTQTYIVTPSRDKEPYFEIKGSPANVERAKKEIERYIAQRTKIDAFDLAEDQLNLSSYLHSTEDSLLTPLHKNFLQEPPVADTPGLSLPVMYQYQGLDDLRPPASAKFDGCGMVSSSASKLASVFQFPAEVNAAGEGSLLTKGEVMNASGNGSLTGEVLQLPVKSVYKAPLHFSGMKFMPPSSSYQQISGPPLLTPDLAYSQSSFKGIGPQPISPTGSFESSCSDGISSMSPNLSANSHIFAPTTPAACYVCNADENRAVLIPCRHSNFCQSCAHYVTFTLGSCPICHTQVTNVMHL